MIIRPAMAHDLDVLVEGNVSMAEETEGLILSREVVRSGVGAILEGRAPGAYRVVEVGGRVVAQLMVTYEWSDWRDRLVWWIQSVYVDPAHRRRGLFRALYEALRTEARVAGAAGLRLYVDDRNRAAQAVYTALGMDGGHYRVFEEMNL